MHIRHGHEARELTAQDATERSSPLAVGRRTSKRRGHEVERGLQLRNSRELEPQLLFRIRETPLDRAEGVPRRTAVHPHRESGS